MGFFYGCWPNEVQLKHLVEQAELTGLVLIWNRAVVGGLVLIWDRVVVGG
jgi:hypothetical protein